MTSHSREEMTLTLPMASCKSLGLALKRMETKAVLHEPRASRDFKVISSSLHDQRGKWSDKAWEGTGHGRGAKSSPFPTS